MLQTLLVKGAMRMAEQLINMGITAKQEVAPKYEIAPRSTAAKLSVA